MTIKRLYVVAFAIALAAAVACTHDKTPFDGMTQQYLQEVVLSAYPEEGTTKTRTSRDTEGNFYWSPGDQISLFYGCGENGGWQFTSTNNEPTPVAEFRGYIDVMTGNLETGGEQQKFWGVYPFSEKNSCHNNYVVTEVPSVQTTAEETFSDGQFVSIGCSTGLDMGFYHLCGGIKFNLQGEGISRITLKGNQGEVLGGTVEVMFDEGGIPYANKVYEEETVIVLTPPKGESYFRSGVNYYIVTLPTTFTEGFTVSFERDGMIGSRYIGVEIPIHRAKFQWSDKPLDIDVLYYPADWDVKEYDIVNPQVRRFLEEVDYSNDPEYTYTKVTDYSGTDKPEPVYLEWTGTASKVLLSTSPDFIATDVVSVDETSSPAAVYNLIPGVPYYYQVTTDSGIQEGCVLPVGPLRMIYCSTRNVRDMGGWKAGEKTVAYGKLYRGAQISSSDQELFVKTLGINVEIDLRGKSSSGVLSGVDYYYHSPVMFMNGRGDTAVEYQKALRDVISSLSRDKTVYFHCMVGADRTGTLAFIIGALLGISEGDLSKEFELTSFYSKRTRNMESQFPFKKLVYYLRGFEGNTIQEKVESWAKTSFSSSVTPITDEEIMALREAMLE